jgi:hypothetical protein
MYIEAKCVATYGTGAIYDGVMCACKKGYVNSDDRCVPDAIEQDASEEDKPSKLGLLAKTGAKAVKKTRNLDTREYLCALYQ